MTPANVYYVGQRILREMRQVILNLQSYATDDEAALIMVEIIRGLKDWEESRASEDRVSCMVVLEEATIKTLMKAERRAPIAPILAALHDPEPEVRAAASHGN